MRRVWTVAGGKGGAGRTLLAANLGIALARAGRRVTLLDLDPHGAALHTALGFGRPVKGLQALDRDAGLGLEAAAVDTPIHSLRLVCGLPGPLPVDRHTALLERVERGLEQLEGETLLVDCGSGRSRATLEAFALGSLGIIVTTPEPAALGGACQFADALLRRALERSLAADVRTALHDLLKGDGIDSEILAFRSLMVRLGALDAAARDAVEATVRRTPLELVLTQVRDEADEEAGLALASAFLKAFGLALPLAGFVTHDPSVLQAVQKHRPLAQQFPNTPATKGISRAAERLLRAAADGAAPSVPEWEELSGQTHYRVMEVVPKASSKEIQAAYQILKRACALESTPLLPVLSDEALQQMQTRVEEAYRNLIFLESRVIYDRSLVDAGLLDAHDVRGLHGEIPVAAVAAPSASEDPAAVAESPTEATATTATAGTADLRADASATAVQSTGPAADAAPAQVEPPQFSSEPRPLPTTGEALRQERQRLGQTLEAIASRTKIRQTFLAALEQEEWDRLPSPVFLRGFVREFALCLGLPADAVAKALLSRREQALARATTPAERRSA
ncbi:MAG TPA: helix-turn-helix domain-containing protein [Candidatus Polarisedimenticolia bacterium]|jgi:flagellar biosynthesis protein FlhG|nr:helix-turn-helix domain-containing protein [Candidatus Polarisedimenticolia bacterium]